MIGYRCVAFARVVLALNSNDITAVLLNEKVFHFPCLGAILQHEQHTITAHHVPTCNSQLTDDVTILTRTIESCLQATMVPLDRIVLSSYRLFVIM